VRGFSFAYLREMTLLQGIKIWLWNGFLWLTSHKAKDVLYFCSLPDNKKKYIYFVVLGEHCPDEEKFYALFPDTRPISEGAFEHMNKQGVQMVLVGDAKDVDTLEPEPTS